MKSLQEIFPRSSKSFQEANSAAISSPSSNKNALAGLVGGKKRGSMNKTEAEFAHDILEPRKVIAEISRYEYEGITLRWAGIRYTPDFVVFDAIPHHRITFIEVKGGFVGGKFERAIE